MFFLLILIACVWSLSKPFLFLNITSYGCMKRVFVKKPLPDLYKFLMSVADYLSIVCSFFCSWFMFFVGLIVLSLPWLRIVLGGWRCLLLMHNFCRCPLAVQTLFCRLVVMLWRIRSIVVFRDLRLRGKMVQFYPKHETSNFTQLTRFLRFLFVLSIGRVVRGVFLVVLRQNRLH